MRHFTSVIPHCRELARSERIDHARNAEYRANCSDDEKNTDNWQLTEYEQNGEEPMIWNLLTEDE